MSLDEKTRNGSTRPLPLATGREAPPVTQRQSDPTDVASAKWKRQEIFLPVSGFVWLFREEVAVVNHPAFQRLSRIYQLGQSYVVYRGATHKRFEHALGTLHVAQRMISAVESATLKAATEEAETPSLDRHVPGTPLSMEEERFVRLGALLHDIGHIAAGHTIEDELSLIGKHDQDGRLSQLFDGQDWRDAAGRSLSECIDQEFAKLVPKGLREQQIGASAIVRQLIRKPPGDPNNDTFASVGEALARNSDIRLNVCRDMIGNTICADLLDYLHRDWYHIGKPRSFDERILQYMEIRTERGQDSDTRSPQRKQTDRFVISLGQRPKIRTDAISAILELLEWRYQLAESVLFHRTKLSAAAMLDRALYSLWSEGERNDLEKFLLPLSDEEMLTLCLKEAVSKNNEIARKTLGALQRRELFTNLATWFYEDLTEPVYNRVHRLYGYRNEDSKPTPAACRSLALENLEDDFRLAPGSLAMYCPPTEMNAKIAQVQISVDGEVQRFSKYEADHNKALSGGHLEAQLHRFRRLWRIHFFIERSEKARLKRSGLLSFLLQAVQKLVLRDLIVGEEINDAVRSIASALTGVPDSPWHKYVLLPVSTDLINRYPSGAPTIRSLLQPVSHSTIPLEKNEVVLSWNDELQSFIPEGMTVSERKKTRDHLRVVAGEIAAESAEVQERFRMHLDSYKVSGGPLATQRATSVDMMAAIRDALARAKNDPD